MPAGAKKQTPLQFNRAKDSANSASMATASEVSDAISRRNNVRIIGLKECSEKDDPVGFLQKRLPKWIPSLQNKATIEIDRAHRIYGKGAGTRTLILRCLRYQDREAIIQGAKQAQQEGLIRDSNATLRFKPDYSSFITQQHQGFIGVQRELYAKGIQNFLIYPATQSKSRKQNVHIHCTRGSGHVLSVFGRKGT